MGKWTLRLNNISVKKERSMYPWVGVCGGRGGEEGGYNEGFTMHTWVPHSLPKIQIPYFGESRLPYCTWRGITMVKNESLWWVCVSLRYADTEQRCRNTFLSITCITHQAFHITHQLIGNIRHFGGRGLAIWICASNLPSNTHSC